MDLIHWIWFMRMAVAGAINHAHVKDATHGDYFVSRKLKRQLGNLALIYLREISTKCFIIR